MICLLLHLGCFGSPVLDVVKPPSGSVIAGIEGTENVTTLICNISAYADGVYIGTQWSLQDFNSTQGLLHIGNYFPQLFLIDGDHSNQLTVLNMTKELDGVKIFCGTGAQPQMANFTLRIRRKINNSQPSSQKLLY